MNSKVTKFADFCEISANFDDFKLRVCSPVGFLNLKMLQSQELSEKRSKFPSNGSILLVNFSFSFSFVAASPSEMCSVSLSPPATRLLLRMVIYEQQKPCEGPLGRARRTTMEIFTLPSCAHDQLFVDIFNVPSC